MRNDKAVKLSLGKTVYMAANAIGKNYNPTNHPNPFSHLLSSEVQPFDPLAHFQLFECELADWKVVREFLFCSTLNSYLREYTTLDAMDEKTRHEFILQYCFGNGDKLDAQFLKEPYRNNPEILLAVKYALSLIVIGKVDDSCSCSAYHNHVIQSAFSAQYPFDNSFKKFLVYLRFILMNKWNSK